MRTLLALLLLCLPGERHSWVPGHLPSSAQRPPCLSKGIRDSPTHPFHFTDMPRTVPHAMKRQLSSFPSAWGGAGKGVPRTYKARGPQKGMPNFCPCHLSKNSLPRRARSVKGEEGPSAVALRVDSAGKGPTWADVRPLCNSRPQFLPPLLPSQQHFWLRGSMTSMTPPTPSPRMPLTKLVSTSKGPEAPVRLAIADPDWRVDPALLQELHIPSGLSLSCFQRVKIITITPGTVSLPGRPKLAQPTCLPRKAAVLNRSGLAAQWGVCMCVCKRG